MPSGGPPGPGWRISQTCPTMTLMDDSPRANGETRGGPDRDLSPPKRSRHPDVGVRRGRGGRGTSWVLANGPGEGGAAPEGDRAPEMGVGQERAARPASSGGCRRGDHAEPRPRPGGPSPSSGTCSTQGGRETAGGVGVRRDGWGPALGLLYRAKEIRMGRRGNIAGFYPAGLPAGSHQAITLRERSSGSE